MSRTIRRSPTSHPMPIRARSALTSALTPAPGDPLSEAPRPVPLAVRLPQGPVRRRARSPSSWSVACLPAPASRPASRATMAAGCFRRATSAGCRSCRLRAGAATSPSRSSRSRCEIGMASSRTSRAPWRCRCAAPSGRVGSPIPIAIDPQALSGDDAPLDAIIVRDLPADATLSAGAYDPAIDGWVLLPRQAGALTVTPGTGQTEGFTLTLLGVRLADDGGGHASSPGSPSRSAEPARPAPPAIVRVPPRADGQRQARALILPPDPNERRRWLAGRRRESNRRGQSMDCGMRHCLMRRWWR